MIFVGLVCFGKENENVKKNMHCRTGNGGAADARGGNGDGDDVPAIKWPWQQVRDVCTGSWRNAMEKMARIGWLHRRLPRSGSHGTDGEFLLALLAESKRGWMDGLGRVCEVLWCCWRDGLVGGGL